MSEAGASAGPHPALVRTYAIEWRHGERTFEPLVRYNMAHVIAAVEAGVVPRAAGSALLAALRDIGAAGFEAIAQDEALDGHQPNLEAEIRRRCGAEISGWLSIGRARQECEFVARQIAGRDTHLSLLDEVAPLLGALLALARREADTVMPYATWGQPAEPITLGYYAAALAEALVADIVRFRAAHRSLSRSRAEIGQVVPSPLPIDRERVAGLLGFPALIRSSLYGYASLDAELEALSALSILAGGLARASENLFVWCSPEYGFLRFGDAFSGTSYLMPQKRNPYALRMVRPLASQVAGALTEAMQLYSGGLPIVGNGLIHIPNRLIECLESARDVCTLLALALPTLEADRGRMRAAAASGWAQAPQLVYLLVQDHGLPFRQAHHVVAEAVRTAGGSEAKGAPARVAEALMQAAGGGIEVEPSAVERALNVEHLVATRTNGGPAPASVHAHAGALEESAQEFRRWLDDERRRLTAAQAALDAAVETLAGEAH